MTRESTPFATGCLLPLDKHKSGHHGIRACGKTRVPRYTFRPTSWHLRSILRGKKGANDVEQKRSNRTSPRTRSRRPRLAGGAGRVRPGCRTTEDRERRMTALHGRSEGHQILTPRSDRRLQLRQPRGRLALQDRQPGFVSRIQVGRDATHDQRRAVHDGWHATVCHRDRCKDR